MSKDTSGSAFPAHEMYVENVDGLNTFNTRKTKGMTLRQWYAGLAMQSLLLDSSSLESIATLAYQQADAMLLEGSK